MRSVGAMARSFQDAMLYPGLTVFETIAVARERHLAGRDMFAAALQLPASFESELASSLGGGGGRLASTDPRHITTAPGGSSLLASLTGADQTRSTAMRNDGNDVDMDYEMARLAETSLRYDMLVQATGARLSTLRDIVSHIS